MCLNADVARFRVWNEMMHGAALTLPFRISNTDNSYLNIKHVRLISDYRGLVDTEKYYQNCRCVFVATPHCPISLRG